MVVRLFGVTWKVRLYSGGRVWVGPGVPMLPGDVVGTGVMTVVGTGVGVAGGVGDGWVHPAVSRMMVSSRNVPAIMRFFIGKCGRLARV